MAANSFGYIFRITTWGESHGKAVGVVVDGCPAGLPFEESDLNLELKKRSPGQNPYTTPRQEIDHGEILSGVFEGKTTGTPICMMVRNQDADSSKYEPIKDLLRPGHANYTYLEKYGIFDYRGGGRSSARETIGRVAAGAVAKKLLKHYQIEVAAYIKQIGSIEADIDLSQLDVLQQATLNDPLFCPDIEASEKMRQAIEEAKQAGDSLGGIVEFTTSALPVGLGDPIYEKLEANLADAMMSLPATKGFEIGSGFKSASMSGSQHNDLFINSKEGIRTVTNYAGGTLGGMTTGMPLLARVAFKPTSSIKKRQDTLNVNGEQAHFVLPEGSRHDPCVAIRAVPIVEAMVALVLADALLSNRCVRL